jgi:MFS family permease
MTNFLAIFWKREMGLSNKQIAGGAISGIVLEVLIFFFGPEVSAFFGCHWMLLIAQAAMAARSWLYWAMPDEKGWYWAVLAVELLKGVAFGFTHLAGVKTAAAAAPPGLQATSQSIYNSIYAQLPAVIAAFVGARLYSKLGPHHLFLIVAIISTASMAAFLVKYVMDGSIGFGCKRKSGRKEPVIVVQDQDGRRVDAVAVVGQK